MTNKEYPSVACSDSNIANSLSRFLKYNFGFKEILINHINDPFKYKESIEIAEQSEFLIIDAFINGEPKGFHFAKQMKKKTLLLFYSGEIEINNEGKFWLVLPYKLKQLREKIEKIIQEPAISYKDYKAFEEKFPKLKENPNHHS